MFSKALRTMTKIIFEMERAEETLPDTDRESLLFILIGTIFSYQTKSLVIIKIKFLNLINWFSILVFLLMAFPMKFIQVVWNGILFQVSRLQQLIKFHTNFNNLFDPVQYSIIGVNCKYVPIPSNIVSKIESLQEI